MASHEVGKEQRDRADQPGGGDHGGVIGTDQPSRDVRRNQAEEHHPASQGHARRADGDRQREQEEGSRRDADPEPHGAVISQPQDVERRGEGPGQRDEDAQRDGEGDDVVPARRIQAPRGEGDRERVGLRSDLQREEQTWSRPARR